MSYKNTQHYRYTVHRYLDGIWMLSSNKRKARTSMYSFLSKTLDIPIEDTHVSKFTRQQCKRAIQILRPMYIQIHHKDIDYKKDCKNKGEFNLKLMTTSSITFETAHILPPTTKEYKGLYSRTYNLKVCVTGEQIGTYDMIIPQEELKEAMENVVPDRKFIFNSNDIVCKEISTILKKYEIPYVEINGEVVAENLIQYIYPRLKEYIQNTLEYKNVQIVSLELSSLRGDYSTILKEENLNE